MPNFSAVRATSITLGLAAAAAAAKLDARGAAALAAKLANDSCARAFRAAPFRPESYPARLDHGRWRWGRMDPAGVHGYSAQVSFDREGRRDSVQVFYSTDQVGAGAPAGDSGAPADTFNRKLAPLLPGQSNAKDTGNR